MRPGTAVQALGARSPPRTVAFGHIQLPLNIVSGNERKGGFPWQLHAAKTEAPTLTVDFSGTWIKDKTRSDSMDEALKLMSLGGLLRQAIKLIKGVSIQQTADEFTMSVFSVLSWFKVTERYKLDGDVSLCRRRDFRGGKHRGRALPASGDRLVLQLEWDDPYGGKGTDEFYMPSSDELHITSAIAVHGQAAKYRSVYSRKK